MYSGKVDNSPAARATIGYLAELFRFPEWLRADELLNALLPRSGRSFRLGISGVPGVGKSTFIEALGLSLIDRGHRERPIEPNYVGITLDTRRLDHVLVSLEGTDGKDEVRIVEKEAP